MNHKLETLEVVTGTSPVAAVIWLHGLGADGSDFVPIVEQLNLPVATRFVFPHAPVRAVTINGGARMRAWYDILSMERTDVEDESGIRESAAAVAALIDAQVDAGIKAEQIFVAGFSQGGAIALFAGLRFPKPLAGILALSTYLPMPWTLEKERSTSNVAIPILMAHGSYDPVLPEALGKSSRQQLEAAGYAVEWQSYPMAHSVCNEEIIAIDRWFSSRLAV